MQRFLLDLGVPASAIRLERRSRTTAENAQFTAELLRPLGIRRVLLVTSALHMERARARFENAGLKVVPVAADHVAHGLVGAPAWQRWLPDADALARSAAATKELVGRVVL